MESVHYRCTFDIYPTGGSSATWTDIVKTVRSWISKRLPQNEFLGSHNFFTGGGLSVPGQPRLKVSTAATEADCEGAPEFWAVCFEHPDNDCDHRTWQVHIGITRSERRFFRISLMLVHSIVPGFIEEPPPLPLPSAPFIVKSLIKDERWNSCSGSERLRISPDLLRVGGGPAWRERLLDPKRGCPLVFVSQNEDGRVEVDPNRLATLLAGVANVVTPESLAVDQELQWVLPERLRAWGGTVRVYVPGITALDNGSRHRFFSPERIAELTPLVVENILVEALARRSAWVTPGLVTTTDDVAARRRESRIHVLRRSADEVEGLREWIGLLEEENRRVSQQVRGFEANNSELRAQLDRAEAEREDAFKGLNFERNISKYERERAVAAEQQVLRVANESRILRELESFPNSPRLVVALAAQVFSDRIAFTESALKSAENSSFASVDEMSTIWRCLRSIATDLYKLYFPDEDEESVPGTFPQRFEASTGLELAPTEGTTTRKDGKIMDKRRVMYKGEWIDIEPHVKYDKGKKFLRIHYYVSKSERLLVVGHCGDHMDTAATRRRK